MLCRRYARARYPGEWIFADAADDGDDGGAKTTTDHDSLHARVQLLQRLAFARAVLLVYPPPLWPSSQASLAFARAVHRARAPRAAMSAHTRPPNSDPHLETRDAADASALPARGRVCAGKRPRRFGGWHTRGRCAHCV